MSDQLYYLNSQMKKTNHILHLLRCTRKIANARKAEL